MEGSAAAAKNDDYALCSGAKMRLLLGSMRRAAILFSRRQNMEEKPVGALIDSVFDFYPEQSGSDRGVSPLAEEYTIGIGPLSRRNSPGHVLRHLLRHQNWARTAKLRLEFLYESSDSLAIALGKHGEEKALHQIAGEWSVSSFDETSLNAQLERLHLALTGNRHIQIAE